MSNLGRTPRTSTRTHWRVPHGKFDVALEEGILRTTIDGLVNEVCIENYVAAAKFLLAERACGGRWLSLCCLDCQALAGPEVVPPLSEFFIWCRERGCLAIAVVAPLDLQRFLLEQVRANSDVPEDRARYFTDPADAEAWLMRRYPGQIATGGIPTDADETNLVDEGNP